MSLTNGQVSAWPSSGGSGLAASRIFLGSGGSGGQDPAAGGPAPIRNVTPMPIDGMIGPMPDASLDAEDENRRAHFAELFRQSESKIASLFRENGSYNYAAIESWKRAPTPPPPAAPPSSSSLLPPTTDHTPIREPPFKRVKRAIDEDDYDDYDDGECDNDQADNHDSSDTAAAKASQADADAAAAAAAAATLLSPSRSGSSPVHSVPSPGKVGGAAAAAADRARESDRSQDQAKVTEDARKRLEQDRTATEQTARRSFFTIYHTLENDRTAMLEQQRLEESEKQLQAEMDHSGASAAGPTGPTGPGGGAHAPGGGHGTLSSTNLGASSLTLKHLIARIDLKRDQVAASDAELRLLMNEVRKNRSKWANEENVNQEELYEALDKVLSELKAHTEYSTPFLSRVNKRDAPDYYNFIKNPMDLGSMTKKLKSLTYKSKTDFVADLNLIWDNCLRYNRDMNHPLRRMANGMRKEAEKLIPLIPDLAIRPRAEVEAEERRKQNGGEDDNGDDSDDEPIMSSRGRTAGNKGANRARQTAAATDPVISEGTPAPQDQKFDQRLAPAAGHLQLQPNGLIKGGREGSEAAPDGAGHSGFGTPPVPGPHTPALHQHGSTGGGGMGGGGDAMDSDGPSLNTISLGLGQALGEAAAGQVYEDEEYRVWKQVTKKGRALVAKERYQLFTKDGRLNPDAPALLRTRAGIRRYLKNQKEAQLDGILVGPSSQMDSLSSSSPPLPSSALLPPEADDSAGVAGAAKPPSETLAEDMEEEGGGAETDRVIPDYYEPLNIVPHIPSRLQWIEDAEGQVINQHEEFLQLVPPGHFTAPQSRLTTKFDAILRQIQDTRKLATRVSVVKQMQVQTQVYANQFPRTTVEPFVEQDIESHFISDNGPIMAAETSQAGLRRTVAKILYYHGFEELQPSALDTLTSMAAHQFHIMITTFKKFAEAEKKEAPAGSRAAKQGRRFQPRFTREECILHGLQEGGHDVASLDAYAREEVDRHAAKLASIHERMKAHLTDLLRPALTAEAGADGVGAFNDGSEQFISGDFAEDLGEDFFGFRALGLDQELGLDMISVPLHLLQRRVRSQYQQHNPSGGGPEAADILDTPEPLEPVSLETIQSEIGLVRSFLLAKLQGSGDQALVEDEDLPVKQRRPRPRLGNTGKIVSPQKRPPREQIALAKKRKKMEAAAAAAAASGGSATPNGIFVNGTGTGTPERAAGPSGPGRRHKTVGLVNGQLQNPALALAPKMERVESAQSTGAQSLTDRDDAIGEYD